MVEDRGPWNVAVHGVAKSWTWLSDWTTTTANHHPMHSPCCHLGTLSEVSVNLRHLFPSASLLLGLLYIVRACALLPAEHEIKSGTVYSWSDILLIYILCIVDIQWLFVDSWIFMNWNSLLSKEGVLEVGLGTHGLIWLGQNSTSSKTYLEGYIRA